MHEDCVAIGRRLTAARVLRGYSMETLGLRAGFDKSTISRYERGFVSELPFRNIVMISDALEVNPAWVMGSISVPATRDVSDCAWLERCLALLQSRPLSVSRIRRNSRYLACLGLKD